MVKKLSTSNSKLKQFFDEENNLKKFLDLIPNYYKKTGNIIFDHLMDSEQLIRVKGTNFLQKKVYLLRYDIFNIATYNPYSKKTSFINKGDIAKIITKADNLDLIVKKTYLKRIVKGTILPEDNKMSLEKMIIKRLKLTLKDLKMKKGGEKEMGENFNAHLGRDICDYIIDNEIPIKVIYSNGDTDEGVYMKMLDTYNYLLFNAEEKISILAHKGNISKIEVMGDIKETI